MPLRGVGHSKLVGDEAPFFDSLAELDAWFTQPHPKLAGVFKYQCRPLEQSDNRGKLLVCHDYKGGYTESPSRICYTFNFWSLCDTFVYFSHHRITVPPSGWINAAHKQGVKMLGVLILEHSESNTDGLKLLLGNVPSLSTGSPAVNGSIPISAHYASRLAELAFQRGFDGYLLNFESSLPGGSEQARALTAWITLLRAQLRSKVGTHADVVWYDSVIITGELGYQNRLNHRNLPFFLASDALFTNYFWPPHYPVLEAGYFLTIDPVLLGNTTETVPTRVKTLQSVMTGVDVWGRGQYGGGGFNSYRAITHINPQSLGLSVALFGPGWTWESEQDKPGWNWERWWEYERKLWIGPSHSGEIVPVPDPPELPDNLPPYNEGPFKPLSSFFMNAPPPDPVKSAFFTCFSPGVGWSWFVNGMNVLQTEQGWTDIDKQCSIGNLAWPRPALQWEGDERVEDLPTASTAFDMTDGWNGGNTLKISVACGGSDAEDAFFQCIWLPVQSLTISPGRPYEACIVYKPGSDESVDLDLTVMVKLLSEEETELTVGQAIMTDLSHGWSKQELTFTSESTSGPVSIAIGLVVGFVPKDPSLPCNFVLSLGKLAVYPSPPTPPISVGSPRISWAHFTPDSAVDSLAKLVGVLTWDTALTLPPMPPINQDNINHPEDSRPAWVLDGALPQSLSFLYSNIYVSAYMSDTDLSDLPPATFIGTTGLSGHANRFHVEPQCLPQGLEEKRCLRLYVQGVTHLGEVLPWERCAFVDYTLKS
ncbi:glycoside hydrolase family 85 protein [Pisolithus marmoratus]|nr:glycoside hydrolase family 85 protein [Pisolithus marmoratus]